MSWISIGGTKRYQLSYKALGKLLFLILLSFTKLYNFRKITAIYRDHYHMSIVLLCRGLFHDEYYFIIKLRHQLFFEVSKIQTKCAFGWRWKIKIISLFSLFLLLFIGLTALFGTIHGSHYTISTNFYFYLQYFQQ